MLLKQQAVLIKESLEHLHYNTEMKSFKDYLNPEQAQINESMDAIDWHIDNRVPLHENVYRVGSKNYFSLWRTARQMVKEGTLELSGVDKQLVEETDIGEFAEYNGKHVPLDCPMFTEEKDVELNKPKRGGSKKFYVYVKNPKTGNIKKIEWGDTTGLSVKINDPKARASFAARHKCDTRNDKTTPSYWACRTPRYAKQLGLSKGGSFFW